VNNKIFLTIIIVAKRVHILFGTPAKEQWVYHMEHWE